jgi:hypothetical protein
MIDVFVLRDGTVDGTLRNLDRKAWSPVHFKLVQSQIDELEETFQKAVPSDGAADMTIGFGIGGSKVIVKRLSFPTTETPTATLQLWTSAMKVCDKCHQEVPS